jgi:hypothetical protein
MCHELYQTGTILPLAHNCSTLELSQAIHLYGFSRIRNGIPGAPVPKVRVRGPQLRHPDLEYQMGNSPLATISLRASLCAATLFLFLPSSHAQTAGDLSGRYQCVQVRVQHKVQPCTAAPLILKNDGRFELRGWEGSYLVSGEWVELSDTLQKTRARIEPGHKIALRYSGKKGLVEMIYERRVAELGKTSLS